MCSVRIRVAKRDWWASRNGLNGILEAFSFLNTARRDCQIGRISAKILPGKLKRGSGTGAVLIKDSDHALATKSRDFLDFASDHVFHGDGSIKYQFNLFPAHVLQPQQVLSLLEIHRRAPFAPRNYPCEGRTRTAALICKKPSPQ
jgi:hypothetical protein